MTRVIDDTFSTRVKTLPSAITNYTLLLIDGNVMLYQVKNDCDSLDKIMTINDVRIYCNNLAKQLRVSEKVIAFDGAAPIQKLPEQIKRRKRKYENYSALQSSTAFDISNQWFLDFLLELEETLAEDGWNVIGHDTVGEGEQKLADIVRDESANPSDMSIIAWTRDWDLFVILLNIQVPKKLKVYLMMALTSIDYLIDIQRAQIELRKLGISPLHYMACCILFGCDFHPGIGNYKLTPNVVSKLFQMPPYAKRISDRIIVDNDLLTNILLELQGENCDSVSSNEEALQTHTIVSYSNVPTSKIRFNESDCGGKCLICTPKKFCSKEQMNDSCFQFLNMHVWTLNYFSGLLSFKFSAHTNNVYVSHISPSLSSMIKWLEIYDVPNDHKYADVAKRSSYKNALYKAFELDFVFLPPCSTFEFYEPVMCCKDLGTLSIFR